MQEAMRFYRLKGSPELVLCGPTGLPDRTRSNAAESGSAEMPVRTLKAVGEREVWAP
jgi:hypothetical protein